MKIYFKKIIGLILICAFIFSSPINLFAVVVDLREQGEASGWAYAYAILSGFFSGYNMDPKMGTINMFTRTYLIPRVSRDLVALALNPDDRDSHDQRRVSLYSNILSSGIDSAIYGGGGWGILGERNTANSVPQSWWMRIPTAMANSAVETWIGQQISRHYSKKDREDAGLAQFMSWLSGLTWDLLNPVGNITKIVRSYKINKPSESNLQDTQKPSDNTVYIAVDEDAGKKYQLVPDGTNPDDSIKYKPVLIATKGEDDKYYPTEESKTVPETKDKKVINIKWTPDFKTDSKKAVNGSGKFYGPWSLLKLLADGYGSLQEIFSNLLFKHFARVGSTYEKGGIVYQILLDENKKRTSAPGISVGNKFYAVGEKFTLQNITYQVVKDGKSIGYQPVAGLLFDTKLHYQDLPEKEKKNLIVGAADLAGDVTNKVVEDMKTAASQLPGKEGVYSTKLQYKEAQQIYSFDWNKYFDESLAKNSK